MTPGQIAALPHITLEGADRIAAIRDLSATLRNAATVANGCKLLGTGNDLADMAQRLDRLADTMEYQIDRT